jgi:hypothetical protein
MKDHALAAGTKSSHVLMGSWFTHAPLIGASVDRGLDVIGMVKPDNTFLEIHKVLLHLQKEFMDDLMTYSLVTLPL